MSTTSTALALLKLKCPRCHKGNLFINPNPYYLKDMDKMPEKCPCCGQRTEIEPGFYYGAMYCSYGICVLLFLVNFAICQGILDLPGFWFLPIHAVILLGLWPFIFRYARTTYLYLFVHYDPTALNHK